MRIFLLIVCLFISSPSLAVTINILSDSDTTIKTKYLDLLRQKYTAEYHDLNFLDKSINRREGLFIAIGTKALRKVIELKVNKPVIAIFIKQSNFYHTLKSIEHNNLSQGQYINLDNIGAIFSDPPISMQTKLIKEIFGAQASLGVITSPITSFLTPHIQKYADENQLSVEFINFTDGENINKVLNSLKDQDVLFAMPDKLVWNSKTLKNIVLSTYRNDQPIIGFSRNLVKAGAIATYYTDLNGVVMETIDRINEFKVNKPPTRSSSKHNSLVTNSSVLRSFGLKEPEA
tara:strand:- start:1473 stop:2339 length:867 start_codon:yes stop_codon:yes gene_type:complete